MAWTCWLKADGVRKVTVAADVCLHSRSRSCREADRAQAAVALESFERLARKACGGIYAIANVLISP